MQKTTENHEATLLVMLTAASKGKPVTISYIKADGTKDVRTIEIFKATVTAEGFYLLHSMDREKQAKRTFRVDRITHYTIHTRLAYVVTREEEAEELLPVPTTFGGLAENAASRMDLAESHGDHESAEQHWSEYLGFVALATGYAQAA